MIITGSAGFTAPAPGGGQLAVRGGCAGIAVSVDELRQVAAALGAFAERLRECAGLARSATRDLGSFSGRLLDPGGQHAAQAAVDAVAGSSHGLGALFGSHRSGSGGLGVLSVVLTALADKLRQAADIYERADAGESFADQLLSFAGFVFGAATAAAVITDPPLLAVAVAAGAVAVEKVPGASQISGGIADQLLVFLARNPALTEEMMKTVPNVLGGSAFSPSLDSSAEAARLVAALAAAAGMHAAGKPWFAETGTGVALKPLGAAAAGAGAPAGVAGLMGGIPPSSSTDPVVRIERIDTASGRRWIVSIPGTDSAPATPGVSPFDAAGALALAGQRRTAGIAAVEAAMRQVRIPAGEPVLLAGHSQGGMIAAAVAADESVTGEFTITHVVTAGSPIAGFPIPDNVQVLSLEHSDDFVPKLDDGANPDRATWTTVTAPALRPGDEPFAAHDVSRYAATAALVDASANPSIRGWAAGASQFFGQSDTSAVTWTVHVRRAP